MGHDGLGGVALGDVGDVDRRRATRGTDLLVELPQAVLAAGDERDGGTVPGEPEGGGGTDAAGGAGDEGDGSVEGCRHAVLLPLRR